MTLIKLAKQLRSRCSVELKQVHVEQFGLYCAVPENIHTHPMEGQWKFQGGGGSQKPKC